MNTTTDNADFLRAVVLVTAFKPEAVRRCQAATLYLALHGTEFTGDCLPRELFADNVQLPGIAIGSLARIGLLESAGFVRSPSATRHGSYVQLWRLATGKLNAAQTWLKRNGFPPHVGEKQEELFGAN